MKEHQINLFDVLYNDFKFDKNKPVRVVEMFAGIGTQRMGFERAEIDVDVIAIVEVDKHALLSYAAMHTNYLEIRGEYFNNNEVSTPEMVKILQDKNVGFDFKNNRHTITDRTNIEVIRDYYLADLLTNNLGDVSKVRGSDLPKDIDMLTYSFPCFVGDTLVMTDLGFKEIKNIEVGDKVITHDGTFKEVVRTINNGVKETVKVKGMGFDEIITTPDHLFYTRELKRVYYHNPNTQGRRFEEPKWTKAKDLNKNTYIGIPVNTKSKIPKLNGELKGMELNNDFWYIIGQYIGDGWYDQSGAGVYISNNKIETKDVVQVVGKVGFKYSVYEERTADKIRIASKDLHKFVKQFGYSAKNKRLNNIIFDLPTNLLKSFLKGYVDADGSFTQGLYKTSSISRELSYGIGMCVAKVYKQPFRLYKHKRNKKYNIEGRIGEQAAAYQVVWKEKKKKQDKAFFEDNFIWLPFKRLEQNSKDVVYDLEVEENHSYTANGIIVHNCTDLSKAGQQKGLDGTRSGLVYEVFRIVDELKEVNNKPKTLLMENVIDLIQKKFINEFHEMQFEVETFGYQNYTFVMNAKDYGVAQNRNRVFMLSIPSEMNYVEPKPLKLTKRLKDYLEDDVDESFYMTDVFVSGMNSDGTGKYPRGERFRQCVKTADEWDISTTITTREGNVATSTFISDVPICLNSKVNGKQPSLQDRIYSDEGTMTAITTGFHPSIEVNEYPRIIDDKSSEGFKRRPQSEVSPTILCDGRFKVEENKLRIRKLTPRECWRLMGIDDDYFIKAQQVSSNAQLYKQAGNAIVVDVFANIVNSLI